ncbi:disulfide bond formation protein B [Saccharophagus sp. K07]|jgi:disulfide bond formation protein DsbB|uniref:disulfide bond formation protein B n=1 Tax=Saccharophagus sp. K07 TaxID=2283636 RepID=UPI0016521DD5|nr:disulfide bond formation protein B [Saccharophagus sp. K07]MBC6906242.1 disulfide bond formation protein B [Saccharophagus sp. K07]
MPLPSSRQTFLLIFLGCTGLILTGLYMQYFMDLYPCPLCITQRIFIIAVGLTGLLGFIFNPQAKGRKIFGILGVLFAILGGSFSTRQLWLQSLPPDQVPACGPDISYLLENFPLMDALSVLLRGDGNCAEVVWTFLGISIPGWTLVAFIGLALFNIWQILRRA